MTRKDFHKTFRDSPQIMNFVAFGSLTVSTLRNFINIYLIHCFSPSFFLPISFIVLALYIYNPISL